MTTTSKAVANEFIRLASKQLTRCYLEDLVYIAQGYSLAINDCPLYPGKIKAYPMGPVIPKLYGSDSKIYSQCFVTSPLDTHGKLKSGQKWIVEAVYAGHGHCTESRLSELTRQPGTPWYIAWKREPCSVIDQTSLGEYYREVLEHGQT